MHRPAWAEINRNASLERPSYDYCREAGPHCPRPDGAGGDNSEHGFGLISVAERWARLPSTTISDCGEAPSARMRKRRQKVEGRKPYGFYEGGTEDFSRMKTLRAESLGFDPIAPQMNVEAVQTRTRGQWHGVLVNRILKAHEGQN